MSFLTAVCLATFITLTRAMPDNIYFVTVHASEGSSAVGVVSNSQFGDGAFGVHGQSIGVSAPAGPMSAECLGCLCHATTGCHQGLRCEGATCGPFRITWEYWADAGKPTLQGHAPDEPDAFSSCAIDSHCAAQTVQNYMKRYSQDCNKDGRVDCYDFLAIHKLGPSGCNGELPHNQCVAALAH